MKKDQKILIVDDNAKNLQVAMNILKNYNVLYAQSGQKALNLVQDNYFDLILLDIVMPEMNGYEVCKILKNNEKTKEIPIIFLTVKDEEADIVKGFEYGAVDYITKPFYTEVLLKRVQLHLQLARNYAELSKLNKNLNELVKKQVDDLREKDKILFKQSKILAVSEMIDMMSEQLTYPLGLLKMQNQALEIKYSSNTLDDTDIKQLIKTNEEQLNYLNMTIEDFKSLFKHDARFENVNLNVIINTVLIFFKDMFIKDCINVKVKGDVNLKVFFIRSELKHILLKLILDIYYLFENSLNINNKEVEIFYEESQDYLKLDILCNAEVEEEYLQEALENDSLILLDKYNLGLHLVKMMLEKNNAELIIKRINNILGFEIKFFSN